jgi:hypothetical protein
MWFCYRYGLSYLFGKIEMLLEVPVVVAIGGILLSFRISWEEIWRLIFLVHFEILSLHLFFCLDDNNNQNLRLLNIKYLN